MFKASPESFDITVPVGESAGISLALFADTGNTIEGGIYTDHIRIVPEKRYFAGNRPRLRFLLDCEGLVPGDIIKGSIILATRDGEFTYPVHAMIGGGEELEAGEAVTSLRAFSELARKDPQRALKIFAGASFAGIPGADVPSSDALRRGLLKGGADESALEEYLVGMGLKSAVRLKLDMSEAFYENVRTDFEEVLIIRRSTWGAFRAEVSADADFIELPKKILTDEDFVGLTARIPYRVRTEFVGRARRSGRIVVKAGRETLSFDLTVSGSSADEAFSESFSDRKLIAAMAREMVSYMLGRTDARDYSRAYLASLERLSDQESPEVHLAAAAARLEAGDRAGGCAELMKIGRKEIAGRDDIARTAYLMMAEETGLASGKTDLEGRARELYTRYPGSIWAYLILIKCRRDVGRYPARKLAAAESAWRNGIRSPLLYASVLPDLISDDTALTHLSPFMIDVLVFAMRRDMLTQGLALRAAYLSGNEKSFSEGLFRVLAYAYSRWKSDGILEAAVRTLIKGRATDPNSFPWYEAAVERGLKIIRLYEYYIETMPQGRNGILPAPVRKYFAMSDTLPDSGMARLYANVVRNRAADPGTYSDYRDKVEAFAARSLAEGKETPDHAVLYQKFIDRVRSPEEAERLISLVFARRVVCDDRDMRYAVAIHDGLRAEERVPLIKGSAVVHVYSDGAKVLTEDAQGRRYASAAMRTEPLADREPFLSMCRKQAPLKGGYLLSEYERVTRQQVPAAEKLRVLGRAGSSAALTDAARMSARRELLRRITSDPDQADVRELISQSELPEYAAADLSLCATALLESGCADEAYTLILENGTETLSPQLLAGVASRMTAMLEDTGDDEDTLTEFVMHVMRQGTYDERMVSYLVKRFHGGMSEMQEIRRAAEAFYIDTSTLDARILARAVFTGSRLPNAPKILKGCSGREAAGGLLSEYLEIASRDSLAGGEPISAYETARAAAVIDAAGKVPLATGLAFIKACTLKDELSAAEESAAERVLEECARRGIRLEMFGKLPGILPRQYGMSESVFVEEHSLPGDEVHISYSLTDADVAGGGSIRTERMSEVFPGIFSREFVLFYGERLSYKVTVTRDGETVSEREDVLFAPRADSSGVTAYERINALLKLMDEGRTAEAAEAYKDLVRTMKAVRSLFA